jgi:pilus assembly protein CpaE
LAAPVALDRDYEISPDACDLVIDIVRQNVPCLAIDLPHTWSPWVKRVLLQADEIVITAIPDLANLRNAKNMVDLLKASRPNDHRPHYCLNQVGVPKRPEISPADFAKALESDPLAVIPFEPQLFGPAANNGQMIAEMAANHKTSEMFRQLAQSLTGRTETKRARASLLSPLLSKFKKKKAG